MSKKTKNVIRMVIGFVICLTSMYLYDMGEEIITTSSTGVIIRHSLISYLYAFPLFYGFALTVKGAYTLFGKKLLDSFKLR